ncbi:hypothetical protein JXB12_05020 [candidate division KSB1 bacterium]|nr:hypothetical protein [candidate division KSB1 bacterium]
MDGKKSNFIDYLATIVKWRKFIIINFLIVSVITAAFSLIMPKTYSARAVIFPPAEEDQGFGLSQFISNLPMGGFGMAGISEESYVVMAIVNSRTVMEAIVDRFKLIERYEAENMEQAVKTLRNKVSVEINEDGTISLNASAKTPYFSDDEEEDEARNLARDMANAFIEELDLVNRNKKSEKARNTRIYIEKRYNQNLDDLTRAEDELKIFQEEHGVIAMPEQTVESIKAAAEISAQINLREIELEVMNNYVSPTHSEVLRAKNELSALKRKYQEMMSGGGSKEANDIFIPFDQVPEVGVQYVRLYREVKLQETLLEFLLPQYEQAKIQEAKDTPTVQILDAAVPPILRSSPKRGILVISMAILSVFISLMVVLLIEYLQRLRYSDYAKYREIENMMIELRNDYKKIRYLGKSTQEHLPEGREDE